MSVDGLLCNLHAVRRKVLLVESCDVLFDCSEVQLGCSHVCHICWQCFNCTPVRQSSPGIGLWYCLVKNAKAQLVLHYQDFHNVIERNLCSYREHKLCAITVSLMQGPLESVHTSYPKHQETFRNMLPLIVHKLSTINIKGS